MRMIKPKNLRRKIQIARDPLGVPSISANSQADAFYGLGFMHAQDRATQMMFARCLAEGRAAEQTMLGTSWAVHMGFPQEREQQRERARERGHGPSDRYAGAARHQRGKRVC